MSSRKEEVVVKNDNPKPQRQGRSRTRSQSRGRNDGRSNSRGRRSLSRGRTPVQASGTITTGGRGTSQHGAVVRETIHVTSGDNGTRRPRSSSRGRWRPFRGGRGRGRGFRGGFTGHLERQITNIKKKIDGPKVAKTMKGTLTIGPVTGNISDLTILERKFHIPTHPCLLKDMSSGTALTPLTDTAKDYALWKLNGYHVRLMPLVNSSNVTGSIIICSLDQNGDTSKDVNIDDLMTRPYSESSIGRRTEWRINPKLLEGPRQGWYLVDTNEPGPDCLGPAVDIHLYGTTYDLLKVSTTEQPLSPFGGPLWIVQIVYSYSFANYEPKPGMGVMDTATLPAENIAVGDNGQGELTATISEPTGKLHRMTVRADPHRTSKVRGLKAVQGGEDIGSTIWQVVTQAGETAAEVVPGPWSWLIKGGLWFARRLFGGGPGSGSNEDETTTTFLLYPDFEQAQRDVRITTSGLNTPITLGQDERVNVTQLNTTNVQNNEVADTIGNVNQFPVPSYFRSDNLLKEVDGTTATGNNTKSMWVLGGYSLEWTPKWSTTSQTSAGITINTYVNDLKYGNQLKAIGGSRSPGQGTQKAVDTTQFAYCRMIGNGKWTGSAAILPHHMLASWSYPVNYMRGILGDPLSVVNTLSAFPQSVKSWGGFYRVVSMTGETGIVEDPVPKWEWPPWLAGRTAQPNGLWACVTACGNRYGYVDNNSVIVVDTIQKDFTIMAFWPQGNTTTPSWGNIPGSGTSAWYILTNNWMNL
nr:MAG: capsid protein [Astroviridae sp.]